MVIADSQLKLTLLRLFPGEREILILCRPLNNHGTYVSRGSEADQHDGGRRTEKSNQHGGERVMRRLEKKGAVRIVLALT